MDRRKSEARRAIAMLNARMTQAKRILLWLMLSALAALITFFIIRGYLSPEMLFNFINTSYC